MDLEHLSEYILPLLILLIYGVKSLRKKKATKTTSDSLSEEGEVGEEEIEYLPSPLSNHFPPPPAHKTLPHRENVRAASKNKNFGYSAVEPFITSRKLVTNIEEREFISAISDERAERLVSQELSGRFEIDSSYSIKPPRGASRGKALFGRSTSLKRAFILQEILKNEWVNLR
jgi:hypothetical protein